MSDLLHRPLRHVLKRSDLLDESDLENLWSFDFDMTDFLSLPDSMQKTKFRTKALKVAKYKIDMQRDRGKKTKADVVVRTVLGETFNPFMDQDRQYFRYVSKEPLKYPRFK